MRRVLVAVAGTLGIWLVVAPWVLAYADRPARYVDPGFGVAFVVLTLAALRPRAEQAVAWVVAALGVALVALGLTAAVGDQAARADETLVGLVLAVVGLVATQLSVPHSVVAVDKDGRTLAEITSIRRKGDLLAMKGQLLGSMPATIYLTPEELWKIVGLIDPGVAFALPRLLVRGWWRSRQRTIAEGSPPSGTAVGH